MRMPTDYQIFTSAPFLIIWHLPTAAEQHNRSALPVLIALSLLLFPPAGMPRGQQKKREMSSRLSTYFCPLLPPSWKREIAPTARTGTMVGTLFPTLPACLASQVQGSSAPLLFFFLTLCTRHTPQQKRTFGPGLVGETAWRPLTLTRTLSENARHRAYACELGCGASNEVPKNSDTFSWSSVFSVPYCRRPAVAQKRVCLFWRDLSGTVGNSASEQLGFRPAFRWAGCLALSAACCSCLQTTLGSFIHSRARLGFRRGYWILFSYVLAGPFDDSVPYLNPALMSTVAHERCV